MQKKTKTLQKGNMNYPVGDYLVRLKNAGMAGHKKVSTPLTKLVKAVAETLKKEGYLNSLSVEDGTLVTELAYRKKEPVLTSVKLISKPGLRIYLNVDELAAKRGPALVILSTSNGVLTAKEAIKKRIGGEIIAEVL